MINLNVQQLDTVPSTNTLAREQAAAGAPEGTVIIANAQTAGRGRNDRVFFSPADTGLYLSLILRPEKCPPQDAMRITTMAAVAVCQAIEAIVSSERMTDPDVSRGAGATGEYLAQIKWVNDIFLNGRKVCGILTEGSFDDEGYLDYAILGIGVNVGQPESGFPEELAEIAGAILRDEKKRETLGAGSAAEACDYNDRKSRLATEILNRFMNLYDNFGDTSYMEEYRRRCFVIGREIQVLTRAGSVPAMAIGLNQDCNLQVRYPDGRQEYLSSGEISIRV